jgi:hypothetical protein
MWVGGKVPKNRKKQYVKSWGEIPEKFRTRMMRKIEQDGVAMSKIRSLVDQNAGIEYILRPKTKWVNSWDEKPKDKAQMKANKVRPSEIGGLYDPNTHRITAVRGKIKDWQILHEEGHSRQRFAGTSNPSVHAYNEIKADMFAYKKIGKPRHNRGHLNFTFLELGDRYKLSDNQALQCILDALRKAHAPREWFDDFDKLVKEVNSWSAKAKVKKGKEIKKGASK